MNTTLTFRTGMFIMGLLAIYTCAVLPVSADHGDDEAVTSHATTAHHDDELTESERASIQAKLSELRLLLDALIKAKGQSTGVTTSSHTAEVPHAHAQMVEAKEPVPTITVEVKEGSMGGYTVHAMTTNFTFAPLHADGDHVDGEGHAHINVNGVKFSRMYAPWFYLPAIKEKGTHTIEVELSTNNHSAYAHDGKKIADSVEVIVK